jgi:hypothetical protein
MKRDLRNARISFLIWLWPSLIWAASSTRSPGAVTQHGSNWSNPDSIKASDNQYAVSRDVMQDGDTLKTSNYGFSIPSGAAIDSVGVTVEAYGDAICFPGDIILAFCLAKDKGSLCGPQEALLSGTEAPVLVNGSASLWGTTFAAADFNGSDCGTWITSRTSEQCDIFVDYITITVYYTEGSGAAIISNRRNRIIKEFLLEDEE